jgi:hypothetical protein
MMKNTTIILIAVLALTWACGFGTIAYFAWSMLNWWKLTLIGTYLAVLLSAVFLPNIGYNP